MFAVDKEKHVSQFCLTAKKKKKTLSLNEHKTLNRGYFKASKAECTTQIKQTNNNNDNKLKYKHCRDKVSHITSTQS